MSGSAAAPAQPARHALAWPLPAAYASLRAQAGDDEARAALTLWRARGFPLVVRRRDGATDAQRGDVAVGLPLPPAQGKRRLAFVLSRSGIERLAPPLALRAIAAALPPPWCGPLAQLDGDARTLGVVLHGFGALAWQAITGLAYAHPASDVDLVFRPATARALDGVLALFDRWERDAQRRIDAEIAFGDDACVQWREWRAEGAGDRVLVKSAAGAALVARAALFRRMTATAQTVATTR